ncbi:Hypothetical_protein [Hexamita inflata]|uniref:Hypothetical_protein n=1 Tax=Hexamita inflata TaxID=28002 RepID=A0ABP1J627_9EUKA
MCCSEKHDDITYVMLHGTQFARAHTDSVSSFVSLCHSYYHVLFISLELTQSLSTCIKICFPGKYFVICHALVGQQAELSGAALYLLLYYVKQHSNMQMRIMILVTCHSHPDTLWRRYIQLQLKKPHVQNYFAQENPNYLHSSTSNCRMQLTFAVKFKHLIQLVLDLFRQVKISIYQCIWPAHIEPRSTLPRVPAFYRQRTGDEQDVCRRGQKTHYFQYVNVCRANLSATYKYCTFVFHTV